MRLCSTIWKGTSLDSKEYRMAHQQEPVQPESLQISKSITRDNWDDQLIGVLNFLYNYEEWFYDTRSLIMGIQGLRRGQLQTVEQLRQVAEAEMWNQVRFFEYHGYAFEPPDESDFWISREDWTRAVEQALAVGEPGMINFDHIRARGEPICQEVPL